MNRLISTVFSGVYKRTTVDSDNHPLDLLSIRTVVQDFFSLFIKLVLHAFNPTFIHHCKLVACLDLVPSMGSFLLQACPLNLWWDNVRGARVVGDPHLGLIIIRSGWGGEGLTIWAQIVHNGSRPGLLLFWVSSHPGVPLAINSTIIPHYQSAKPFFHDNSNTHRSMTNHHLNLLPTCLRPGFFCSICIIAFPSCFQLLGRPSFVLFVLLSNVISVHLLPPHIPTQHPPNPSLFLSKYWR